MPDYLRCEPKGAPVVVVLKTRKGELDSNWWVCWVVNARWLETRVEKERSGSDYSWETLKLGCRRVCDETHHVMHTENPGHETDHQELGSGHCHHYIHKPNPTYQCLYQLTLQTVFMTILNVYFSCTLIGKYLLWLMNYRRNRINFVFFLLLV
jgi:hypothetical protein